MVGRPGNEAIYCSGPLPIYHAHMGKIPGSPHLVIVAFQNREAWESGLVCYTPQLTSSGLGAAIVYVY